LHGHKLNQLALKAERLEAKNAKAIKNEPDDEEAIKTEPDDDAESVGYSLPATTPSDSGCDHSYH
jgi:hypothetical protein